LCNKAKTKSNSFSSWEENEKNLSQITVDSDEERELVAFLKRRWLSKACGYWPLAVNWCPPCYGLDVQIHPESTRSYARDQGTQFSRTYEKRVEEVKRDLAFSCECPLILTRPSAVKNYLPSCIEIDGIEKAKEAFLENPTAVLNLTRLLQNEPADAWETKYRALMSKSLKGAIFIQEGEKGD
jgi:hypothetical protein